MNRLRLPVILILSVAISIVIQACNKDAVTAIAYTTAGFQANIDGATWAPDADSLTTVVTYDPGANTKTLSCIGTKAQKRVSFSLTVQNASNTQGFPTGTYPVDNNLVKAQYSTQQLSNGSYVFLPQGTVQPGGGSITISSVDSVKKTVTGTFSFYSRTTNYDNSGNVISISVDNITGGVLNATPYTFINNL